MAFVASECVDGLLLIAKRQEVSPSCPKADSEAGFDIRKVLKLVHDHVIEPTIGIVARAEASLHAPREFADE
jgi:hypothetical protein